MIKAKENHILKRGIKMREPCFDNLLKVLRKQVPDRPTLFEFALNDNLVEILAGERFTHGSHEDQPEIFIKAFKKAGFDYASLRGSAFRLDWGEQGAKHSKSLNEKSLIYDTASFEKYTWANPEDYDYSRLERARQFLPDGMKLIVIGPGGVLENVIELTGFDNLCYMLADEPELVEAIFNNVGERLVKYYEICASFDTVGALVSNDDWGFNTGTMLSPADMRKYVFPWHKKIVEVIHKAGKPAILHSCGNLKEVMDDIIYDMGYDAKHSFEDKIFPVEKAYDELAGKIAVLGGIDMDFVARGTPEEIKKRCMAMLEKGMEKGGYALGTGNSVPDFIPVQNFLAIISCAGVDIKL